MRLLLIAVLLAALPSSGMGAEPAPPDLAVTRDNPLRTLEKETFLLINQYRKEQQLPVLAWDDTIARVARSHSNDMATGKVDFGHDGFSQRVDQLKTALTGLRGAGENVLRTDDPSELAARAVDLWLKSPHHLENIRGDFNYSGLGIWQGDKGVIYFTQIFVKIVPPAPAAQAAQAQPPPGLFTPRGVVDLPMPPRPTK
jgi:uncharacterized protein YkwD